MAGIKINIDSRGAKQGSQEVNAALQSMSDQAVKSVKAIDATQNAIKWQTDATKASLRDQLAAIDQTRTRFQTFVAAVGQGAQRVSAAFTTMSAAATRFRGAVNVGLVQAMTGLQSFGAAASTVASRVRTNFNDVRDSFRVVQSAVNGLIAALAIRQFVRLTQDAVDTASVLVDTADRLGITVERLQELQFAAAQSGVSVEQFTQGMETFTRRLAEAAAGSGPLRNTLKGLGLDAKELAQDPAKAVILFADKIAGIHSQAKRLDIARDAFAGLGDVIVNFAQQGGAAIEGTVQELRDLNGVMTDETARAAEKLGDDFNKVSNALGTQFKTALIDLAPLLIKTAELIALTAKVTRDLYTEVNKFFTQTADKTRLADVEATIKSLEGRIKGGLSPTDILVGNTITDLEKSIATYQEERTKLLGLINNFSNVTAGTTGTAIKKVTDETKVLTEEQIAAQKAVDDFIKSTTRHAESLNLTGEALAKYVAEQKRAEGATEAQVQQVYAAVLADERAEAQKKANAKAIQDEAEAKREAEQLAKAIDADRIKREEFLSDLLAKRAIEDQEHAKAKAASLLTLQQELIVSQEEGQLIQASLASKEELRRMELAITAAQIDRAAAAKLVADGERQLSDEEKNLIETTRLQQQANLQAKESFTAMQAAIDDAALSTADLKTVTQGILSGTQSLGGAFKDLGETAGARMIEGILFGKGQNEKAILGNFNQLLSVDAAGIFSTQGNALGGTLVSSITSGADRLLKGAGIDLGSMFGSSFGETAGATATADFSNVIAGGTSTAASSGSAFGTIFGAAAGGAAGIGIGKGIASVLGIGGSKQAGIGGTVGGGVGAVGGGILGFVLGGPAGAALGAGIGGAAGSLFGSLIGGLFAHTPTRGTEIRKGVKEFLKDIEVSFADEIKSGNYFFEETKALAEKMFGGSDGKDFLKASKVILEKNIGPELSKQLSALGAAITADQAQKLGKNVEQTSITFGNLLLDNLGLNPETIDAAIQETVQKAGISLDALAGKLTGLFTEGEITQQFYNDAIMGAVDIFNSQLPDAINVAALALKSFGEDGLFDIEKFNAELAATTGTFEVITQSFIDVVRNSKPGEDVGKLLAEQITTGLEELAVTQFLNDFVKNQLFAGIDLSQGLGADEAELLKQRAVEAANAVELIRLAFGGVSEEVEETTTKVDDLFSKLRALGQQRFDLRLDVIGNLEAIGALSGVQAAQAAAAGFRPQVERFGAGRGGLGTGPLNQRTDLELEQGVAAVQGARNAQVQLFRAQEQAARAAQQNRIADIQTHYQAERDRQNRIAQEAQRRSEERIQQLGVERDQTEELFQLRLDGLREELQVAQEFQRVAESIQGTLNQLVTTASPFSRPEQIAVFQRQAAELRGRIAGAPPEQQAGLIEELTNTLSQQLQIGKEFLDPTAFSNLFSSVVGEMERLRDQATGEADRVAIIQQQIADTTLQMDASLRGIDARIEQARADGVAAQQFAQEQAERLSELERIAVAQAEASTNIEIDRLRSEAVEEIRRLAVIEDQLLAEQQERAAAAAQLSLEQVGVLHSIDAGISTLTGSIIGLLDSIIGAQTGYDGIVKHPQLFLAHANEHVRISPAGQGNSGPISINLSVPIAISGSASANPRATEEAIIDIIATEIRKDSKVRNAIKGVK